MADTFTSKLRLREIETNTQVDLWAPIKNSDVVQLVETAIAGRTDIDVTASSVTLTTANGAADQARAMFIHVSGTAGAARNVFVPSTEKMYIVRNGSDFTINVRTVAIVGAAVSPGQSALVFVDETADVVRAVTIEGDVVFEAADWQTGTADIVAATAGDTQVSYRYSSQGAHAFVLFQQISTTISLNSFSLSPNTPAAWPAEIIPESAKDFMVFVTDDGTPDEAAFNIPASSSASWTFDKADGNAWTPATIRSVDHTLSLFYNVRGF